jgi:uncharacterized membrane protein YkoI
MLTRPIRKTAMAVAALGALALGGSAIAGAANGNGSSSGSSSTATQTADHGPRAALSADVAAKVKAAALAKVPGATVLETEAGGPDGTPYHAHIRTSDGKLQVVLVNASFQATAVQADDGHGPGGRGDHGGHGAETALTGDTKSKVEAAVLAKYPGATIERTETNTDGSAPYESHIKTSAGGELEVHVSTDFAVVDARQHPAHP